MARPDRSHGGRRGPRTVVAGLGIAVLGVGVGLAAARTGGGKASVIVYAAPETTLPTASTTMVTTTTMGTTTTLAATTTVPPTTRVPTTQAPQTTVVTIPRTTAPPPAVVHRITGAMYLFDAKASVEHTWTAGAVCTGQGGYSDVRAGANVTVKDGSSSLIGATTLGPGVAQPWPEVGADALQCVFPYSIANVPDTAFYTFEVGRRGAISRSKADVAAKNWTMSFYLGS